MKRYITGLALIQLIASSLLCFKFNYSPGFTLAHFATITFVSAIVAGGITLMRAMIFSKPVGRIVTHLFAFGYWAFVFLFYLLVLGSNFFWGNTITFDILGNYLKNFNEVISIFPVERWIILTAIGLTIAVIALLYYWVRIREPKERGIRPILIFRYPKVLGIGLLGLILCLIIFSKPLLDLKRTLQFQQEPLSYFIWGPMWEIHSDQLLLTQPPKTVADEECIASIEAKPATDRIAFVILLDALRSDHLPLYGYSRNTAPFLDSISKTGKLRKIPYAFSGSTNTIGGVSSLFYSRSWDSLNLTQLNLMQYFKLSGFETYAFLTGYHSGWYGLSAMYRNSCDHFFETTASHGKAVDDDFVTLSRIESTRFKAGDFVYIHLLSTHDVGKREDRFRRYRPDKIGLTTDQTTPLVNHYDNGILQADYIISRIFKHLESDSLLSKATIFIVGDHGNLFGEEGKMGHAGGLHPKLLETPILIYDANSQTWPERKIATLKDIAPTFSELFFNEDVACWRGRSLLKEQQGPFTETVTAATVKTALYNGLLTMNSDSIQLKITDKIGHSQGLYQKIGQHDWMLIK